MSNIQKKNDSAREGAYYDVLVRTPLVRPSSGQSPERSGWGSASSIRHWSGSTKPAIGDPGSKVVRTHELNRVKFEAL